MRIHVHRDGEPVPAHGGCSPGEEAGDARGHASRRRGLDEELGAVPAPQAQERRGAEQVGSGRGALELAPKLGEDARRAGGCPAPRP